MRIQPLLLLAALPLSLASTNTGIDDPPCLGTFCIAPVHQRRGDPTSQDDVTKTWPSAVEYYRGAMESQARREKQGRIEARENPVVGAEGVQSWNMRNGNRNKGIGNLGKRIVAEDNPICQVFFWDGRQGGCTFLTGSMATGICRMKADRISPFVDWKDGDCAEVVVGHRSDDVSGVWAGCEIRRAWKIEGECRTR